MLCVLGYDDHVAQPWIVVAAFAHIGSSHGLRSGPIGTGKPLCEQSAFPLRNGAYGKDTAAFLRRIKLHAQWTP